MRTRLDLLADWLPRRRDAASAQLTAEGPVRRPCDPRGARRSYTPVERMMPARLQATHDDVERIRKTRRGLPALPGLNDYRAILHAHAEDSSHTGGTRPEMLSEARKAGVQAIFLSDHHRPPRDFIRDSWRGLHEGVLFVPGSEANGFLLYPIRSIMEQMNGTTAALIEATRADGGLIFLSHIEERPGHSMAGLDGMEIYNRHFDAKKDAAGLLAIMLKLTAAASLRELEESLNLFPDELFAAQVQYPAVYLAKWDAETQTQHLTGVAANDCHHNYILAGEDGRRKHRQDRHECRFRRRDAHGQRCNAPRYPRADERAQTRRHPGAGSTSIPTADRSEM